ncbi:helix-hairpin-helix domain-containing protein [Streptosporangium lutulentum]|uniref:Flap endonuclease-1-like 5' DNA nuclease n=1 Tax=Streptosporangium lutulentum TaxID=1461250 RepID=A0ABT9QR28_9ACTN|nr:helix-hairpin-helix domain-containing protein [Streptosporangium lutulentum]MDP9849207.1 putative flap endonuclease-1-like 5' DNA nuclease [Streptosporangium lutulentum]
MTDQSQGKDDIPSNLGVPARRALAAAGYTTLAQVASATEQELLRLHGMGPKAIRLLRAALAERDLALTDQET